MVRKTFASSVMKIDANGNRVLSDYVDEDAGERLEADVRADESVENSQATDAHAAGGAGSDAPAAAENEAEALAAQGEPSGDVNADTTNNPQVPATNEHNEDSGEQSSESSESTQAQDEAPKASDNKDAWFEYAKTKGFEGEKEDLTKEQLIEQYGA